jgi:glutathione S-transferase
MAVELHGFRFSVYVWIARVALAEKGIGYTLHEVNPFAADVPTDYLAMHPFRRVPTLVDDGFILYETAAITRYIDEAFKGPPLQPAAARQRARMVQIIGIIDSYGYWPMVRQVFAHSVFRPRVGSPVNQAEIEAGAAASEHVLAAIEALVEPGSYLLGTDLTLADVHLAPMIGCFAAASEGRAVLARHARLSEWWRVVRERPSIISTEPGMPGPPL